MRLNWTWNFQDLAPQAREVIPHSFHRLFTWSWSGNGPQRQLLWFDDTIYVSNGRQLLKPRQTHSNHCLTHWGRVTHICTIIGSNNGLSPDLHQAIIRTNAGILLIGPLGANLGAIFIKFIHLHLSKCIWKCRLQNGVHFVSAWMC